MKKLLLAVVAFCMVVTPSFAIIGNIGHSTNLDYAGAVVAESVEKLFINVKANGAISAGAVAALDLTALSSTCGASCFGSTTHSSCASE